MADTRHSIDYSQLSPSERIILAEDLWDSAHHHAEAMPLTPEQKQEVQRRWIAFESGEATVSSWPEVNRRLLEK